jgi:hypothetical protein
MASEIIGNISLEKEEIILKSKNSIINEYSKNFNKFYHGLKFPKNSKVYSSEKIKNESNNMPNSTTLQTNKSNNPFSFSLLEPDFEADITPIKKNKKSSLQKIKMIKENNLNLSNEENNSYSSERKPSKANTQTTKIQKLKNNHMNSYSLKSLKSKIPQNLNQTLFSQKDFEQRKKGFHINDIRSKSLKSKYTDFNNTSHFHKKSLICISSIKRRPLYQKRPLYEEKNIEKNFKEFYNRALKENQTNSLIKYSPCDEMNLDEKYNNFYKDKIKWKENVDKKNNIRKLKMEQIYESFIDGLSFKPKLNKNSLYMANKMKRKSNNLIYNINYYEEGHEREAINKYKIKLKPAINNAYNYNDHNSYLNKRNQRLKRTLSEIIINKKNKKNSKAKSINKNYKINYKLGEKKFRKQKSNISIKEQNINNHLNNIQKMKHINQNDNYNNLKKKIILLKNDSCKGNPKPELYKLNIRKGTAWNQDIINEIIIDNKFDEFIQKEFL